MKKISVNGKAYRHALEFAYKACPSSDTQSKLAQVVFLDRRIICSDGRCWFLGLLPGDAEVEIPVVAARDSVAELLIGLEYAEKIARRHSAGFYVEQDGLSVVIHYAEKSIKHKLAEVKCGHVPADWTPPVAPEAPQLATIPKMACAGALFEVVNYWRKHDGEITFRGTGAEEPMRADVEVNGEAVGVAFVLPDGRPAAALPPDEPLFAGQGGRLRGQSILDLSTIFEAPPMAPKVIRIDDREWNINGLGEARELLKSGPCDHRDTHTPCPPCTEIAVSSARADVARKVVSIRPKKRPGKKKTDDEQPDPSA